MVVKDSGYNKSLTMVRDKIDTDIRISNINLLRKDYFDLTKQKNGHKSCEVAKVHNKKYCF